MITKVFIPTRSVIWIMLFSCTFILYMVRVNMSIILIAMVEPSDPLKRSVPECAVMVNTTLNNTEAQTSLPNYGERFEWDKKLQALILGSYFWGFIITGIPGGALAERFGPTRVIMLSFLFSGGLTLLGPVAASWHPFALIATRFLIGLFGGVVYPSLHCLVSRWAPPEEKGKFIGALLGGALGTVATWPLLGKIIENYGWSWAFFSNGAVVMVWCVFWIFLVSDSPEKHPRISETEKEFINKSLAGNISKTKKLPPYKAVFTSIQFWAFVVLHFGNLWGLFFLMTAGPLFMSSVLGFDLGHTGVLASLPYLARLIFGFIFGAIGDLIKRKEWLSNTAIRKSFLLSSHIIPGLLLIIQTFTGCDVNWSIILITISLGLNGSCAITNLQNGQDLAPNFAGTLYGIANCIGSTTGFISPMIVGYLTAQKNGLEEWHIIFYIGSSVYIASALFFMIFGTAEIQPWNDIDKTKKIQNDDPNEVSGLDNPTFIGDLYRKHVINDENTKV